LANSIQLQVISWIVFDEEGAVAAAARTKSAVAFQRGEALESAIANGDQAIVIMPSDEPGRLMLLKVRHSGSDTRGHSAAPTGKAMDFEATGILGLSDHVVIEEPQSKKRWWERISGKKN
jgi:hypothetical protein